MIIPAVAHTSTEVRIKRPIDRIRGWIKLIHHKFEINEQLYYLFSVSRSPLAGSSQWISRPRRVIIGSENNRCAIQNSSFCVCAVDLGFSLRILKHRWNTHNIIMTNIWRMTSFVTKSNEASPLTTTFSAPMSADQFLKLIEKLFQSFSHYVKTDFNLFTE